MTPMLRNLRTSLGRMTPPGLLLRAALIGLALSLLLLLPARKANAQGSQVVKIALVDTLSRGLPPALVRVAMQPFKALLETQVGMSGDIVAGGDALDLARKMADDKVHVGVFHGHEFAWAKARYPKLQAIVVCVNRVRDVRVSLVVSKTSTAGALADLKGKRVAVPKTNRDHCRLYFERRCTEGGACPTKYFRIVKAVDSEEALDQVAKGKADAALVDAVAIADYKDAKPARAKQLKTLQRSEPFPSGVVAYYSGRFSESDVNTFRAGLINARSTPRGKALLDSLKLSAFEAAPADFDALLKGFAESYPVSVAAK